MAFEQVALGFCRQAWLVLSSGFDLASQTSGSRAVHDRSPYHSAINNRCLRNIILRCHLCLAYLK